jgi:glycosyltransferase involved in cell wall biosynthesis
MKILFVAPSAYILGGVQDWLYKTSKGFEYIGHEVTVAIPNDIYHDGTKYIKYYPNINPIFFSSKSGTSTGRINALSHLITNDRFDLIIGVNIGDIYNSYERQLLKLQRTKIIMTLHAIESDYFGDIGKYTQILDGVITTNRLTQAIVKSLHLIDQDKIFYAPYGVTDNNTSIFKKDSNILRIAWVGRLENKQKRILDLYRILLTLDKYDMNYILTIAGDGPLRDDIINLLDRWIKNGKVRLAGLLDKNSLDRFYANHDILLITSEWETGPIVAWEAMLAGVAVVSSKYIGISLEQALVNEETALLFPVGNCDIAASQIHRLLNKELFCNIIAKARTMALSRYSLEASLQSWDAVISKIMSRAFKKKELSRVRLYDKSGHLDSFLGPQLSEVIRRSLRKRGYCRDPGSEWPHSTYGHTNSDVFFKYAKQLEQNQ